MTESCKQLEERQRGSAKCVAAAEEHIVACSAAEAAVAADGGVVHHQQIAVGAQFGEDTFQQRAVDVNAITARAGVDLKLAEATVFNLNEVVNTAGDQVSRPADNTPVDPDV